VRIDGNKQQDCSRDHLFAQHGPSTIFEHT
jgi:hypothetical protein